MAGGMRVYIPFGTEWYPYFMRRLGERPANVLFFIAATCCVRNPKRPSASPGTSGPIPRAAIFVSMECAIHCPRRN